MTAGREDFPGEQSAHVFVVYNKARSRLGITDDTQLSQRYAVRVAGLLKKLGLSVFSPDDLYQSGQAISEIELLNRGLIDTKWTVIIVTPEFLRFGWNTYKTLPALRHRIADGGNSGNTICLCLGVNNSAIPTELSSLKVVQFKQDSEDDEQTWAEFRRFFASGSHDNGVLSSKSSTRPIAVEGRQEDMAANKVHPNRSILDYRAQCIDLPAERSFGSWYHPSLPPMPSPPAPPSPLEQQPQRNSSPRLDHSCVNNSPRRVPSPLLSVDEPPSRFAHLYKPLPKSPTRGRTLKPPSKTDLDSGDKDLHADRVKPNFDERIQNHSNIRRSVTDRFARPCIKVENNQQQSQRIRGLKDTSPNRIKKYSDLKVLGNTHYSAGGDTRPSTASVATTDILSSNQLMDKTVVETIQSVYNRPRRAYSPSPRRTFAYTDHSIDRLGKQELSEPNLHITGKTVLGSGINKSVRNRLTKNGEIATDGHLQAGNRSPLVNASYQDIPKVHITSASHLSDHVDNTRSGSAEMAIMSIRRRSSDTVCDLDRPNTWSGTPARSKEESASKCPCQTSREDALPRPVTCVDAKADNKPQQASSTRHYHRQPPSQSENLVSGTHTVHDDSLHKSRRKYIEVARFPDPRNRPQNSSSSKDKSSDRESFSLLSPIRPGNRAFRAPELPRASSPLCLNSSSNTEDESFHQGDPNGSYLQEDFKAGLYHQATGSRSRLDKCELYSGPPSPDLNRSDLSEDLTYVHSRLEEHSKSLHDHSTRLQQILSKASKAIEVRRSYNSSLSETNNSKDTTETPPFEEDAYFRLPPLRQYDPTKLVSRRNEEVSTANLCTNDSRDCSSEALTKGFQKLKQLAAKSVDGDEAVDSINPVVNGKHMDIDVNYVFRPLSMDKTFLRTTENSLSFDKAILCNNNNRGDTVYHETANVCDNQDLSKSGQFAESEPSFKTAQKQSNSLKTGLSGDITSSWNYNPVIVSGNVTVPTDVSFSPVNCDPKSMTQYDDHQDTKRQDLASTQPSYLQDMLINSLDPPSITDSGVFDRSLESVITNSTDGERKRESMQKDNDSKAYKSTTMGRGDKVVAEGEVPSEYAISTKTGVNIEITVVSCAESQNGNGFDFSPNTKQDIEHEDGALTASGNSKGCTNVTDDKLDNKLECNSTSWKLPPDPVCTEKAMSDKDVPCSKLPNSQDVSDRDHSTTQPQEMSVRNSTRSLEQNVHTENTSVPDTQIQHYDKESLAFDTEQTSSGTENQASDTESLGRDAEHPLDAYNPVFGTVTHSFESELTLQNVMSDDCDTVRIPQSRDINVYEVQTSDTHIGSSDTALQASLHETMRLSSNKEENAPSDAALLSDSSVGQVIREDRMHLDGKYYNPDQVAGGGTTPEEDCEWAVFNSEDVNCDVLDAVKCECHFSASACNGIEHNLQTTPGIEYHTSYPTYNQRQGFEYTGEYKPGGVDSLCAVSDAVICECHAPEVLNCTCDTSCAADTEMAAPDTVHVNESSPIPIDNPDIESCTFNAVNTKSQIFESGDTESHSRDDVGIESERLDAVDTGSHVLGAVDTESHKLETVYSEIKTSNANASETPLRAIHVESQMLDRGCQSLNAVDTDKPTSQCTKSHSPKHSLDFENPSGTVIESYRSENDETVGTGIVGRDNHTTVPVEMVSPVPDAIVSERPIRYDAIDNEIGLHVIETENDIDEVVGRNKFTPTDFVQCGNHTSGSLDGEGSKPNPTNNENHNPASDQSDNQSPGSEDTACQSLVVSVDRPLPRELLLHRIILPSARTNYIDYFRLFGRRPLYNTQVESQVLRGNTSLLSLAYFHVSQDLGDESAVSLPARLLPERSLSEPCLLTSSAVLGNDERAVVPVNQARLFHRRTVSNVGDYGDVISSLTSRGRSAGARSSTTLNTFYRVMCHFLSRPEQFYLHSP